MLEVQVPPSYAPERAYIVRSLLGELLGLEHTLRTDGRPGVVTIRAGDDRQIVVRDGLFTTPEADWLCARSLPTEPLASWPVPEGLRGARLHDPLPVLYGLPPSDPDFFREHATRVELGLDLFGSAFFLLTRYEERAADASAFDARERFPATSSIATRAGFLERPIVDEYLELLWCLLERAWPALQRKPTRYRLQLTHDVDHPFVPDRPWHEELRHAAYQTLRRREPLTAARHVAARVRLPGTISPLDPFDTFDEIMSLSERHGMKSAFYFMTRKSTRPVDAAYDLSHPGIRKLMKRMHVRGHEIGLHPSYDTFRDAERLSLEASDLRTTAAELGLEQARWGGRQHYLRWRNPDTWRHWHAAGLDYDSSVGFHDAPGFRAGTCREYPVFDLERRTELPLRERPLIVMDTTLAQHMAMPHDARLECILGLSKQCRRFAGDFTLLWHNTGLLAAADVQLYERVLRSCSS